MCLTGGGWDLSKPLVVFVYCWCYKRIYCLFVSTTELLNLLLLRFNSELFIGPKCLQAGALVTPERERAAVAIVVTWNVLTSRLVFPADGLNTLPFSVLFLFSFFYKQWQGSNAWQQPSRKRNTLRNLCPAKSNSCTGTGEFVKHECQVANAMMKMKCKHGEAGCVFSCGTGKYQRRMMSPMTWRGLEKIK